MRRLLITMAAVAASLSVANVARAQEDTTPTTLVTETSTIGQRIE